MKNTDYNIGKIYSIEEINLAAQKSPERLLRRSDEHFRAEIYAAAQKIINKSDGGVVMLSGPSSSGKTTTSMMLIDILEQNGAGAVKISLDDFFLAADKTPPGDDGKPDFEGVSALNLDEMKSCLNSLIRTGECYMPRYDFTLKRPSERRKHIVLPRGGYVIIEGLHAVNPILHSKVDKGCLTKLFLNVESGVSINGEILSGTVLRMLRRLVRDTKYRSINAGQCLELWDRVLAGEEKNINPYVGGSDIIIDSFHESELSIIGLRALPLLMSVPVGNPHYESSRRLAGLLENVWGIDGCELDRGSLLTEFVGGGSYEY